MLSLPKNVSYWGVKEFFHSFNLFLLVTKDHSKIFKIIAFPLLGYFWLNLKFTHKYTIVGPMSPQFQNHSFTPSKFKGTSGRLEEEEEFVDNKRDLSHR